MILKLLTTWEFKNKNIQGKMFVGIQNSNSCYPKKTRGPWILVRVFSIFESCMNWTRICFLFFFAGKRPCTCCGIATIDQLQPEKLKKRAMIPETNSQINFLSILLQNWKPDKDRSNGRLVFFRLWNVLKNCTKTCRTVLPGRTWPAQRPTGQGNPNTSV